MPFLRNTPIRRKLTFVTMLPSCVALLVACVFFAAYEQVSFRGQRVRELSVTAEMTGANSSAGLAFKEPSSVEQILRSFSAQPRIVRVCVYDDGGAPFAEYQRADLTATFVPPPVRGGSYEFGADHLKLFHRIDLAGETIGTVFIESDLHDMRERLWRYVLIVSVLMVVSSLIALLIGSRVQGLISRPIADLAKTAARVANEKDYAVRAVKQGEDEIGRLIDGFNEMLDQIQHRDSALQAARGDLEKRVEERTRELATSLSVLNATLDSTADGILAVQLSGKVVCYNSKFAMMWGIPPDVLKNSDDDGLVKFVADQVLNAERFVRRIAELYERAGGEAFDVIELKDGRSFERYVQPQLIDGQNVGMVFNFRDITERKRAEGKLEGIHKQLLETSRQAGMAEVATSVLHNVGNVLNSVNISCSTIATTLRKSRVGSVARAAELLEQKSADLPGFFASDPAGQKLPAFLHKLAVRLAGEQSQVLEELDSLGKNIEHIKDIVAMQQSYAKVGGVRETLALADLVEDALRMNVETLARHQVQVIREFQDVPLVSTEKHKVLQILVNLVRNAKHALADSGRGDLRLVVGIARDADRVRVSVRDNGLGISAENLTRIFAHGFTTKKNGHGFGLHSGALAALDLEGRLTVHSDGPGTGATFTLELPLKPPTPESPASPRARG